MSFVHLHTHSHYSLLKSSTSVKALVKRVKSLGMKSVALTDRGNMYGAVEFYFEAKKEGLNPILGVEIALADEVLQLQENPRNPHNPYSLILLARTYKGYQNLSSIVSFAHKENIVDGMPRATFDILQQHGEDLICLSGGPFEGFGPCLFKSKNDEIVLEQLSKLKEIFKNQFYLEVFQHSTSEYGTSHHGTSEHGTSEHGTSEYGTSEHSTSEHSTSHHGTSEHGTSEHGTSEYEKSWVDFAKKASIKLNIPLVLTNDTRFTEKEDILPHNILIGIGEGKKLEEVETESTVNSHFYIKSPSSMQKLIEQDPQLIKAFENTLKISEDCNIKFRLKDEEGRPIYHLPQFSTLQGRSPKEEIRVLSLRGLEERLSFLEKKKDREFTKEECKVYYDRLDYELSVIDSMGFNGYFLIVQDFIKWSKNNGVPVGPGRGSGAGSIVAYALKITDLDPIPYSLIFERFLNPERISMPDFDIDFCQERRGDVIDYVTKTYGQKSVAQIITYGKLQTRAAIRDVGRVLGFSFLEVNEIVKLIPDVLGITLKESLEKEPRLQEMMNENPQVNKLISLALKVEGLVRHAGIHAAGVIIADGSIAQHAPITSGADGENVVQYDMKNSEKIGLIKFDFLGLKTLTHIKCALDFIKKTKGIDIQEEDISIDDPGIYELMSKGDNNGIFQFEGEGITDLTIKAKPDCFSDIVALNALYRPGPMDMIPDYLERKSGRKAPDYLFPELEEILNETYGIIVYQEHVQLIAAKIANYSLGEADMLRRAMGKKITEEMDKQKARFLNGAKENNYDIKKTEKLFDLMAEFAKYGFNKSHAAAYCVITARTAWLKHYYPVEFFAALLSTEITNTDNVVKYVKDAQNHEIEMVSPHVNTSDYLFKTDGKKIFFSLAAIKGVGQSVVESIMKVRVKTKNAKFESLEEFFSLVDTRRINKKNIESLVKSGALDGLGYNRNEMFSQTHIFLEEAERKRREKEFGQLNLFDNLENENNLKNENSLENKNSLKNEGSLKNEDIENENSLKDEGSLKDEDSLKDENSLKNEGNLKDEDIENEDSNKMNAGFGVQLERKQEWPLRSLLQLEKEVLGFYINQHPIESYIGLRPYFKSRSISSLSSGDHKKEVTILGLIPKTKEFITKKGTRMAFAEAEDHESSVELVIFPNVFKEVEEFLAEEKPLVISGTYETQEGKGGKILVDKIIDPLSLLRSSKKIIFKIKNPEQEEFEEFFNLIGVKQGSTKVEFKLQFSDMSSQVQLGLDREHTVEIDFEFLDGIGKIFKNYEGLELGG